MLTDAPSPQKFANLLTQAIHRIKSNELEQTITHIQDELAEELGRKNGQSSIGYWRRGHIPPKRDEVYTLAQTLLHRAEMDDAWLNAFLYHSGYHFDEPTKITLLEPSPPPTKSPPPPPTHNNGHLPEPRPPQTPSSKDKPPLDTGLKIYSRIAWAIPLIIILGISLWVAQTKPVTTGEWQLKWLDTDDRGLLFVNNQFVADDRNRTIYLDPYLKPNNAVNDISVMIVNGPSRSRWHYEIWHKNQILTSQKGFLYKVFSTTHLANYSLSENTLYETTPLTETLNPTPDTWLIHITAPEYGIVYINGRPTLGIYTTHAGDFDWQDISPFIFADGPTHIKVEITSNSIWEQPYTINLCKNNVLVWSETGQFEGSLTMNRQTHTAEFYTYQIPENAPSCPNGANLQSQQ